MHEKIWISTYEAIEFLLYTCSQIGVELKEGGSPDVSLAAMWRYITQKAPRAKKIQLERIVVWGIHCGLNSGKEVTEGTLRIRVPWFVDHLRTDATDREKHFHQVKKDFLKSKHSEMDDLLTQILGYEPK